MNATYATARVAYFESLIAVFESALTALADESIKSYTIDTGQTKESVTRKDISSIQKRLDWAYMMYEFWYTRRYGGGTILARSYS